MSVWGRSLAKARHWTACCRRRPERGRFKSQSAWSGRKGCVLKTTSRASTPRRRSAWTFVQPTPARLTGQCVTRSATSGAREQECEPVPAGDLAAVAARETGVDGLPLERPRDGGHLRAAVDRRAGLLLRNRREWTVETIELHARAGGVRQRPFVRAAQRPDLGRPFASLDGDRDLQRCRAGLVTAGCAPAHTAG